MKEFYICDCARLENQTITSLFVVAVKQVKSKKNGELYLSLTLADRSGQLQANMWDNVADALDAFEQDDFVKVKGMVHKYNGRWQLTIHKMRKLDDLGDRLHRLSSQDFQGHRSAMAHPERLRRKLRESVARKSLLQEFMADEAIVTAYKNAPAAKTLHHAFVGGLLDHVVSLFTVCDLAGAQLSPGEPRPAADRRLPARHRQAARAGVSALDFVHHRGPVAGPHDHRAGNAAREAHASAGLSAPSLKILIEHMIISHHGHYEFGSPKLPMFPEALMLHYLDDLDSKMESMRAQFEREADFDSPWTSYNPSLARPLLNTRKFLEKGLAAAREAESRTAAAAAGNGNLSSEEAAEHPVEVQPEGAAPAPPAEREPELSPLEALERKFASHKVTPMAGAGKSSSVMDFARFEWVSFDCYGTLVDWETGLLGYLRPLLQSKSCPLSDSQILAFYSELEPAAQSGAYRSYREVLAQVVRDFARELSFSVSTGEADGLADSIRNWQPFEDTVAALQRLQFRYKLAILSNIDDDLFTFTSPKLKVRFDAVVTAQQVHSYKPSFNNFEALLRRFYIPRERLLHVAESLYHDVVPAHALEIATVWVNRRQGKEAAATKLVEACPDLEVPDVARLAELAAQDS